MEVTITVKTKLDTNECSASAMEATIEAYTKACNWVSEHVFRTRDLKFFSLNDKLYRKLRRLFGLKAQRHNARLVFDLREWIIPVSVG